MKKISFLLFLLVMIVSFLPSSLGDSGNYCLNLAVPPAPLSVLKETMIGEARYDTIDGTDQCYANAYYDGGHHLSLPWKEVIGGLNNSNYYKASFGIVTEISDKTSYDCTDVEIRLRYCNSNTENPGPEGNCVANYTCYPDIIWAIDSCVFSSPSNNAKYWGNKVIETPLQPHKYWWWYAVDIHRSGNFFTGDAGCFKLLTQNECTLVKF